MTSRRDALLRAAGLVGAGVAGATIPALSAPSQHADVAEQVAGLGLRIGIVNSIDTDGNVYVSLGGVTTLFVATYLLGSYHPAGGDRVLLARVGDSWVIIGALSSPPVENLVLNYSFEEDALNTTPPSNWAFLNRASVAFPGTPNAKVDFGVPPFDGQQCANVNGIAVGTAWEQLLYSAPIAVEEGQRWTASAWFGWWNDGTVLVFGQVDLWIFWFTSDSATPTFTPIDTPDLTAAVRLDERFINNGPSAEWVQLRQYINRTGSSVDPPGPYEVPAGVTHMRVVLRTKCDSGNSDIFFDRVTAVRVS